MEHPRQATLYLALTRPPLMWGQVPFEAFWANIIFFLYAGMAFSGPSIWRMPFIIWLWAVPVHLIMARATARDYHWARTLRLWWQTKKFSVLHTVSSRKSARNCSSSV